MSFKQTQVFATGTTSPYATVHPPDDTTVAVQSDDAVTQADFDRTSIPSNQQWPMLAASNKAASYGVEWEFVFEDTTDATPLDVTKEWIVRFWDDDDEQVNTIRMTPQYDADASDDANVISMDANVITASALAADALTAIAAAVRTNLTQELARIMRNPSLYKYVGASDGYTLTFVHSDITEGETPFVAVQRVSDGKFYNHQSNSLIDADTLTSSIWTTQVVSDLVPIDGVSSLVTGLYGTTQPYTSLPAGFYTVTVREADGIDDAVLGSACLYWDGSAWDVPESPIHEDTSTTIPAAVAAIDPQVNIGPVNFVPVSPNYTLKVNRNGTITPLSSREIKAGETVAIQFDFSDILNRRTLTSVAEPTSDSANTTIDDYGINGIGDGGKGINVIVDCTNATEGQSPKISVSVTAGGLTYKASHTFTIVE